MHSSFVALAVHQIPTGWERGSGLTYSTPIAAMGKLATVVLIAMATGAPARAQSISPRAPATEKPIDNGPTSPQANSAYQGGGVVLQGSPGGPVPALQPTSPGQVPARSIEALPPNSPNTPPSKAADN